MIEFQHNKWCVCFVILQYGYCIAIFVKEKYGTLQMYEKKYDNVEDANNNGLCLD